MVHWKDIKFGLSHLSIPEWMGQIWNFSFLANMDCSNYCSHNFLIVSFLVCSFYVSLLLSTSTHCCCCCKDFFLMFFVIKLYGCWQKLLEHTYAVYTTTNMPWKTCEISMNEMLNFHEPWHFIIHTFHGLFIGTSWYCHW